MFLIDHSVIVVIMFIVTNCTHTQSLPHLFTVTPTRETYRPSQGSALPKSTSKPSFYDQNYECCVHRFPGEMANLTCAVTGRPRPKITWRKNGEKLKKQNGWSYVKNVTPDDEGLYECEAANRLGSTKRSFHLITGDVFLDGATESRTVEVNSHVEFSCEPKHCAAECGQKKEVDIVWSKLRENGVESLPQDAWQVNYRLEIVRINRDYHEGVYVCTVSSCFGVFKKYVFLQVYQESTTTEEQDESSSTEVIVTTETVEQSTLVNETPSGSSLAELSSKLFLVAFVKAILLTTW